MKWHNVDKIWITGASTGIGRALTLACLAEGKQVAVTGRTPERLEELLEALPPDSRERCLMLPGDINSTHSLQEIYQQIKDTWGGLDMVIANAGIHRHMPIEDFTLEESEQIIATNLIGSIRTISTVLPDFLAARRGWIVGTASLAGYRGLPFAAAYGASKAGLINCLESLRFDLEPQGIQVTIVNPGFVKTPMTERNPFPMPQLVTSQKAASAILRGLRKGRREIHFPRPFSLIMKLLRVLPFPLYHWLIKTRTSRRT